MHEQAAQLERLMAAMVAEHEQLLALVRRKNDAMRIAKPALVADCCVRENELIQRIAELEKKRQRVVGSITEAVEPGAGEPLRMAQIAELAGEPMRGRLLVLHANLREMLTTIRHHNAVARQATEGLLQHVRGVMQSVTKMLGESGTYGRRGATGAPNVAVSSFSVTG